MRLPRHPLAAIAFLGLASLAGAQANHLVLTEVLIDSPNPEDNVQSGEFVEIFNPTGGPIDLSNVYVSDFNNYHTLPASPSGLSGAISDNILRFPAGTTLPSGGVAVVTCNAVQFLTHYFGGDLANYGATSGKLLFETSESNASVPNMISYNTVANPEGQTNFSRTNGGEFIVLFQWDGASDLVEDLDIVAWGAPTGGNAYTAKGGVLVDGPDGDSTESAYAAEAGSTTNLSVAATAPQSITRISLAESSEVATGGNGATGHDESTEVASISWVGNENTLAEVTPGTTALTPASSVADWHLLND